MPGLLDEVQTRLKALHEGEMQQHRDVVTVPLIGDSGGPTLLSVVQALKLKTLTITELDGEARVPELEARNDGEVPVLILPGAELRGGLQNRAVNAPAVINPGCKVRLPVSCIEQGRWSPTSSERDFASRGRSVAPRLRHILYRSSSASLRRRRGWESDQGRVWEDVSREARRHRVRSETGALSDVLDAGTKQRDEMDRWTVLPGQVGVFVMSPRHLGLDVFSTTTGFEEHGLSAQETFSFALPNRVGEPMPEEAQGKAQALLCSLMQADWAEYPGVGAGVELRARVQNVEAVALMLDETLVYLSALGLAQGRQR